MKKIRNMKRPRLATIMAGLALFIVLGGSATAASNLINGKKIKKGTVTAKQLKNKTITKNKLKPALVESLKGQTGPQGPKGDKGAKGDTGAAGTNGVVAPLYFETGNVNLTADIELAIGTLNVPAGKYMVTSTADVFSLGTGLFGCGLTAGGEGSKSATWKSPAASSRTTLPMQMITPDNVTTITLGCDPGDANGAASGTIMATLVQ